jgi:hypothetical protein
MVFKHCKHSIQPTHSVAHNVNFLTANFLIGNFLIVNLLIANFLIAKFLFANFLIANCMPALNKIRTVQESFYIQMVYLRKGNTEENGQCRI